MVKGKAIYWWLMPVLAVFMALSPFPAMETAEASSVSNAGNSRGIQCQQCLG